jgi:acyl dehydratase
MEFIQTLVLSFDELHLGQQWRSLARTVTQFHVAEFAGLSGDFNPIHVDHEFARQTPFGQPVAHGLLGMAIAVGLATTAPRVDTLAFLGIREWNFQHPIAFGDTIHVVSRVDALEPRSNGRRGIVTWHRRVFNQRGEIVQEGVTQSLVQNRNRGAGTGADPGIPDAGPIA